MISDLLSEAEHKMEMAIDHVATEFSTVRTGRANPQLLQRITVDYYGQPTPLQQLASIAVPEPGCSSCSRSTSLRSAISSAPSTSQISGSTRPMTAR